LAEERHDRTLGYSLAMSENRLKIFISAYACEPEKGSEPGIGWNVVNELAKYHEVHVLTRANNRPSIEAALAGRENAPVFHYYDLPKWLTFWKKKRRGYHLYYYLWQYGAYFKYRGFVNNAGFDIVQHLTFANFAMPSLFMFAKPLTVWGPIGYIPISRNVFKALPLRVKIRESLRKCIMWSMIYFEPMRVLTAYRANYILEYAENPVSSFSNRFQHKVLRHSQTGINTSENVYSDLSSKPEDDTIRLLICSEFMHWKGCTWAAEAARRLLSDEPRAVLDVYGYGPEEKAMRKTLGDEQIKSQVRWHGFVTKAEMLQALSDADILLYPSYHHGLATVILQAMSRGLPIIALEGDDIAETVKKGCGLVASGDNEEKIVASICCCAKKLMYSKDLRTSMGISGKRLIREHYEWSKLAAEMSALYQNMISSRM